MMIRTLTCCLMLTAAVAQAQTVRSIVEVPAGANATRTLNLVEEAVTAAEAAPPEAEVALQTRIQFRLNSAELTDTAKAQLRTLSASFNDPKVLATRFVIEGHTDATGTADYNKALSEQRAASVLDFLAGSGVDRSRLGAVGYGEERLIPDLAAESGQNRRVEFLIRR